MFMTKLKEGVDEDSLERERRKHKVEMNKIISDHGKVVFMYVTPDHVDSSLTICMENEILDVDCIDYVGCLQIPEDDQGLRNVRDETKAIIEARKEKRKKKRK